MTWTKTINLRVRKEKANSRNFQGIALSIEKYIPALERSMTSLPEDLRTAARLYLLEGLTIAQVADEMGLSWEECDCTIDQAIKIVLRVFQDEFNQAQVA